MRFTRNFSMALGAGAASAALLAAALAYATPGEAGASGSAPTRNATAPITPPNPASARPRPPSRGSNFALPLAIPSADPGAPQIAQDDICPPYEAILRPEPNPHQNFYFTRGAYTSGLQFGFGGGGRWSTDFPKADRQFLFVMERTLGWDVFPCENPINLADPYLRHFPFLYMLEVGRMAMTQPEIDNLRDYLLAGGFLMIDDFWDIDEWDNWERQIRQVFPNREIVDVPLDHMIFHIIYPIDEVLQVPNEGNGFTHNPALYGECSYSDCTPTVKGIFDDDGRLMVVMTHNSDLGDAWEWAEQPLYPYDRSNYAFSLAFNIIAYAMVY
jgi:hypothetical protein